ncbi:MAG: trypsin-like peptidase domain-containing protein [Nanoarchaeota archaeon]|nr:trypsin-like peptidase domain-containing protein [Nanoarchaeota archaeon]
MAQQNQQSHKSLIILIIILFIIQAGLSTYFVIRIQEVHTYISEAEKEIDIKIQNLDSKLDTTTAEIQNNINELSNTLIETQNTLLETKSDLKDQINSLKAETSSDFSGIIETSIKSVISIRTNVAQGTGFFITNDGYVVTNAHVLEGARFATAITSDGDQKAMNLIGFDLDLDIALLKIDGTFDYLEFEDSDDIKVGEKVIAIGNPLGLSFSVTEGIVSATQREVEGLPGRYIQTDAALNPGNSGGPLINTQGKVIGINNFKVAGDNIGFSLESNYIVEEVNSIAVETLNHILL